MFSFKYNEVSPPSFLKIIGVDQYLLPEIEHYETSVTGSYGDVDGGVRFGKKVFTVHYIIQLDNAHNDTEYIDSMALWLMGNDNKVSKLQLDDSGEYYMARVSDATDFSDAILYGSGTITFTASNPRRYASKETSVNLATSGSTRVNYTGYIPALPVFTIVCPSGTTGVKIENTLTGDYVLVSGTLTGTLTIDNNKKFVALGNEKRMDLLNINSDWITLLLGSQNIKVTVTGKAVTSITMKYTVTK